jgi:peptidyl-prolyl cis-trans isomerase SurA
MARFLGLMMLCLSATQVWAERQLVDRILAVVNDDVVLESELNERISEIRQRFANNPQVLPPAEVLEQEVFDLLILETVQLQAARRAGITITDAELNRALTQIANDNNLSLPEFERALRAEGISFASVREQVRNDLLIRRIQEREVARRIQVTDAEVRQYLSTQIGSALEQREYRIQHVLIPEAAAAQAEALVAQVNNDGADFMSSVRAAGFNPQDLDWRSHENLPSLLRGAVQGLTTGSVSNPIPSANGWHLVYLAEQRSGADQSITEFRVRHILLNSSTGLSAEGAAELAEALFEQINQGANFSDLATQYSADQGSAARGGDLGWNAPSVFVREFADQIRNTPVGAVSTPFETVFGWHILEVMAERNTATELDALRSEVREMLSERKYAEALPRWQQEIRNNAYVQLMVP